MVTTRDVCYQADGRTLIGRLAIPEEAGKRPAILMAHEGGGLNDYQKDRAARLAELGYVAFALDYHGDGKPLANQEEMAARCRMLWEHPEGIRMIARAALEVLLAEPQTDPAKWQESATASAERWSSSSPVTART